MSHHVHVPASLPGLVGRKEIGAGADAGVGAEEVDRADVGFRSLDHAGDVSALQQVPGVTEVRRDNGVYEIALGEDVNPSEAIAPGAVA